MLNLIYWTLSTKFTVIIFYKYLVCNRIFFIQKLMEIAKNWILRKKQDIVMRDIKTWLMRRQQNLFIYTSQEKHVINEGKDERNWRMTVGNFAIFHSSCWHNNYHPWTSYWLCRLKRDDSKMPSAVSSIHRRDI